MTAPTRAKRNRNGDQYPKAAERSEAETVVNIPNRLRSNLFLTCIVRVYRLCFLLAAYLLLACFLSVSYLFLTCVLPVSYLFLICFLSVYHLFLTCFLSVS